jgi:hypothetical protein
MRRDGEVRVEVLFFEEVFCGHETYADDCACGDEAAEGEYEEEAVAEGGGDVGHEYYGEGVYEQDYIGDDIECCGGDDLDFPMAAIIF